MTKKIIVLSGKQFSGKDTVAKFLLEFLPNFKRIGIGDAIKLEYLSRKIVLNNIKKASEELY